MFEGDHEELVRRLQRSERERQRAIDDTVGWQDQLEESKAQVEDLLREKWAREKELREQDE